MARPPGQSESRPNIKPSAQRTTKTSESLERARALRRSMSVPEVKLWQLLRARRLGGLRFRRQHPIGPYAADFYCHEARLVVELDGHDHAGRLDRDANRDQYMAGRGLNVLRITVADLERDPAAALRRILHAARERMTSAPAER